MNRFLQAFTVAVVASTLTVGAAFAEGVGYIDMEKVMNGYKKQQLFAIDKQVREADLAKMQADFLKQLEESRQSNAKSPVTSNQLEKDLNDKLKAKVVEAREWVASKETELSQNVTKTIQEVVRSKQLDTILFKQAVYQGGTDITDDVINRLNSI